MALPDFKLVVAGGRSFDDLPRTIRILDALLVDKRLTHNIVIVSGLARGADSMGYLYALLKDYAVEEYGAQWDTLGKGAGYARNIEMLSVADAVVAFWDHVSKGTKHAIKMAEKKGLPCRVILY